MDDVDIFPLVEAADVVCAAGLATVEDEVYGAGMVLDIQPVTHVLPLAVYGQWAAVDDVVDEEGQQLLRELIRAVIV